MALLYRIAYCPSHRESCIPRGPGFLEPGQIGIPPFFLVFSQVVENFPRVDAGIMAVGKTRAYSIVADRLQGDDVDATLARLQHFLTCAMPTYFGRRAIDTQQLVRQTEFLARAE